MSAFDAERRISDAPPASAVSESDIRIDYSDNCRLIAAANDATMGPQKIFWSDDAINWHTSTLPLLPNDVRHRHPSVDWTSDENAWAVTVATSNTGTRTLRLYKSTNRGALWLPQGDFSVNQDNVDRPRMWVDHSPASKFRDNIYIIWSNGSQVFVKCRKASMGWQPEVKVSGNETVGSGSVCDIKTNPSGDVFAFWHAANADQRKMFVAKSTKGGDPPFGTPVFIADTYGGQPGPDPFGGSAKSFIRIPSFIGHSISISGGAYQTAYQAQPTTSKQFVYAVWADLSGESFCMAPGDEPGTNIPSACKTRIWFSRSLDGGAHWQPKNMINNQTSFNDQFHPRLAVDETNGQLVVVYYDTVGYPGTTGNRLRTYLWMQTSEDNGAHWSAATIITTGQTDETVPPSDDEQYGDYIGLTGYAGTFYPSWTDRRILAEEIWTRRLRVPSLPPVFRWDQIQNVPELQCTTQQTILTSATIGFHTNDDDKDHDTVLTIDVNTVRGEIAAHADGFVVDEDDDPTYQFNDGDDTDPISLLINGSWFTKDRIHSLRIRIHPEADDTWNFDFVLDLIFSDGTRIHLEKTGQSLSDVDPEIEYPF